MKFVIAQVFSVSKTLLTPFIVFITFTRRPSYYLNADILESKDVFSPFGSGTLHLYSSSVLLSWRPLSTTVEPPITGIPNSGQLPHNGQDDMHQLT